MLKKICIIYSSTSIIYGAFYEYEFDIYKTILINKKIHCLIPDKEKLQKSPKASTGKQQNPKQRKGKHSD